MQVREGWKALRLFVVERRVRIAPGEPAPRPVKVVGLPAVDDDVGRRVGEVAALPLGHALRNLLQQAEDADHVGFQEFVEL